MQRWKCLKYMYVECLNFLYFMKYLPATLMHLRKDSLRNHKCILKKRMFAITRDYSIRWEETKKIRWIDAFHVNIENDDVGATLRHRRFWRHCSRTNNIRSLISFQKLTVLPTLPSTFLSVLIPVEFRGSSLRTLTTKKTIFIGKLFCEMAKNKLMLWWVLWFW